MSAELSALVFALFVIFCRIGSCLMVMPGFASTRVPVQVRLFLAVAISLVLSPALLPQLQPLVAGATPNGRLELMATEILNGLFIGTLGRCFMIALQFAGQVMANAIGLGQGLGTAIEQNQAVPAMTSLVTLTGTTLIFVMNLHAEIARALVASYTAMPAAAGFAAQANLAGITDNLSEAFLLCLRISSPFLVYGLVANFAVGLANKMTPAIPIYFISLPFILAGGLVLFGYAIGDALIIFMGAFEAWVLEG